MRIAEAGEAMIGSAGEKREVRRAGGGSVGRRLLAALAASAALALFLAGPVGREDLG